jgi:tRNA(Ile)-lysidine synthase
MAFLETVRRTIQRHNLISNGEKLVVGVSGGADSLALMVALWHLRHTLDVKLHIATLDHGWRGEESAADAQFVVDQASALNVPITHHKLQLSNAHGNLEAASRRARYDFFAQVAHEVGAVTVAVAHHANDQAETVLMHILRGAGVRGLGGMGLKTPLPYHNELTLIRPLLAVTREDIEAYCHAENLHPRHDPTNNDLTFGRNQLRHDTLPNLKQINPNLSKSLVQLADVARTESDYIEQQTDAAIAQHATYTQNQWIYDSEAFRQHHPAIQRRIIAQLAARAAAGPTTDIGYEHIVSAQEVALRGTQGAIAQFTNGIQMQIQYDQLVFEHADNEAMPQLSINTQQRLVVQLDTPTQLLRGTLLLSENTPHFYQVTGTLYLPSSGTLSLRTRREGDRIAPPGMNGKTQKLSDWMINRKIPQQERDYVPLLLLNEDLAAVLHISSGTVTEGFIRPKAGWQRCNIAYK